MKQPSALRAGQKVLAFLTIEGRSFRGVIVDVLGQGVWIRIKEFPAPIFFPYRYIRPA